MQIHEHTLSGVATWLERDERVARDFPRQITPQHSKPELLRASLQIRRSSGIEDLVWLALALSSVAALVASAWF